MSMIIRCCLILCNRHFFVAITSVGGIYYKLYNFVSLLFPIYVCLIMYNMFVCDKFQYKVWLHLILIIYKLSLCIMWHIVLVVWMTVSSYRGWLFKSRHQFVVSFSETLYLHCFSWLSCKISTRWEQPRVGCLVLWVCRRNNT